MMKLLLDKQIFASSDARKMDFDYLNYLTSTKMTKLLLDKQIFASSEARFCQDMRNDGRNTQYFICDMCNFSLDMVLSP